MIGYVGCPEKRRAFSAISWARRSTESFRIRATASSTRGKLLGSLLPLGCHFCPQRSLGSTLSALNITRMGIYESMEACEVAAIKRISTQYLPVGHFWSKVLAVISPADPERHKACLYGD